MGEYFNHTTYPANSAPLSSAAMRAELDAIEAGFDKLPILTGNQNKVVVINGAGDAQTVKTGVTGAFVGTTDTQTLTGKSIDLTDNTLNGTLAEFNAAVSDADLVSLAGAEALTNKTLGAGTAISAEVTNTATSALQVPVGTEAQRPTGADGKVRYNSTIGKYEGWSGSDWTPMSGDYFQADGSVSMTGDLDFATAKNFSVGGVDVLALTASGAAAASGKTLEATSGPSGSAFGFRNKIINGNFDIWQRGTSFTNPSQYTADRWSSNGTAANVTRTAFLNSGAGSTYGCTFTATAGTNSAYVMQALEANVANRLSGARVILSFKYTASVTQPAGSVSVLIQKNSTPDTLLGGTWTTLATVSGSTSFSPTTSIQTGTLTVDVPSDGTALGLRVYIAATNFTNGSTITLTGVQLEEGSVATPFESRPYGMELALCQRYYYRNTPDGASKVFGMGWSNTTSKASVLIPFPVPMRSIPTTLEQSGTAGNYAVFWTSGALTCTGVPTFALATPYMAWVDFPTAASQTVGQAIAGANINTSGYLGWSAEL